MSAPLPCAHCGETNEPDLVTDAAPGLSDRVYCWAACSSCFARGPRCSGLAWDRLYDMALEAWNERSRPLPSLPDGMSRVQGAAYFDDMPDLAPQLEASLAQAREHAPRKRSTD